MHLRALFDILENPYDLLYADTMTGHDLKNMFAYIVIRAMQSNWTDPSIQTYTDLFASPMTKQTHIAVQSNMLPKLKVFLIRICESITTHFVNFNQNSWNVDTGHYRMSAYRKHITSLINDIARDFNVISIILGKIHSFTSLV